MCIKLFGSFELRSSQQKLIKLPTRKVEALLAYLILARERLAGLFWGESPEDKARLSLRAALHSLHQALELRSDQKGRYILLSRSSVQFNPQAPCSVDLIQFESLLEQAEVLKGPERARSLQEAAAALGR